MVKVNCAALPPNLIESEFFGHERGSFTGAFERRTGKFELAHNSTLFLDEIGELPLELQVKLLRVLQEKEIERVGGKGSTRVDVRIIAATNRDLENEVEEGRFRADLYYRLNIFPIDLPSLRNRRFDIPLLVPHFIQKLAPKTGIKISSVSKNALQQLMNYNWPGNIRELEHVIERSMLLADDDVIREIHLPVKKENGLKKVTEISFTAKTIEENEKEHILKTLSYCKGRISGNYGAAEYLGVPPSTLSSKLKRLGIGKGHHAA
jgi:transcriptional regulator with GAF, ATPase, and Fis domain